MALYDYRNSTFMAFLAVLAVPVCIAAQSTEEALRNFNRGVAAAPGYMLAYLIRASAEREWKVYDAALRDCMDWQHNGVKIILAGDLEPNAHPTPGITRATAITHVRTGADKLLAGTVVVQPLQPNAKTAPHHHGEFETALYSVRERARMRWREAASHDRIGVAQ